MIKRTTKLRLRRKVKMRQKQVEEIGFQAEEHIEKHFFKKTQQIWLV